MLAKICMLAARPSSLASCTLWCVLTLGCRAVVGLDDVGIEEDAGECDRHADCVAQFEEPYLCRRGQCLRLKNSEPNDNTRSAGDAAGDCALVLGAENLSTATDVFLFGALTDRSPWESEDALGIPTHSYATAVIDFQQQLDPSEGPIILGKRRLPVAVVCDVTLLPGKGLSSERLTKTVQHLTEVVGVPAIISTLSSEHLLQAFKETKAGGDDVLFLSGVEADTALANIEDRHRVWHLLGQASALAPAYGATVRRLERYLRDEQHADARAALRIALVSPAQPKDRELAEAIEPTLVFNGRAASDNGEGYLRIQLPSDGSVDAAIARLRELRPHVVVVAGDAGQLLSALEEDRDAAAPDEQPPFYVLSHEYRARVSATIDFVSKHPGLEDRLLGVSHAGAEDGTNRAKFLGRRLVLSAPQTYTDFDSAEAYYDAVYYLMYAAAAAGGTTLTGGDLARGMFRVIDGVPFDVGVRDIRTAGSYVSSGNTIRLRGTSGAYGFDSSTDARVGGSSVWCIERSVNENAGATFIVPRLDALRYDEEADLLRGEFPCFPGF